MDYSNPSEHPAAPAEISQLQIHRELPVAQRVQRFLGEVQTPYCYRCGAVEVEVEFTDPSHSLQSRLEHYLSAKKREP